MLKRKTIEASVLVGVLFVCSVFFIGEAGRNGEAQSVANPLQSWSSNEPTFLQVGEELKYAVSYSFFSIGTVSFKILDKGVRNGRTIFKAQAIIESNPSLNWLKEVHIRFYGEIDDSMFSHYWISEDSSASSIDYHTLTFNYKDSNLVYQRGFVYPSGEHKIAGLDTIRITRPGEDGLSLFFYAREHAREKKQVTVPVFIDNEEKNAHINFQDKVEESEIDAVDYPIETVFLEGKADFVGVVGMTGGFRGWFSNDAARIPIVARLNVWIGSIKVQLQSWKREGWQPPRYVESH